MASINPKKISPIMRPSLFRLITPAPDKQLLKHFHVSFVHSSGAGGQHVNTSSSKAQLRLPRSEWVQSRGDWIEEADFDQIMANYADPTTPPSKRFPFFTKTGDILVESQQSRRRDENLQDCLNKLASAMRICSIAKKETDLETKKQWAKRHKAENEKRIQQKRQHSNKKAFRGKVD